MKIFLSHSFDKKDRKTVKWFEKFIPSVIKGVEVITTRKPELKAVWTKINGKIRESVGVVGILTKDVKVEGKNEWKAKDWIISELAYASGRGLPAFAFVEKGVSVGGIIEIKEYVNFERKKINKLKKEAREYLTSVFTPFVDQTYNFDSWKIQTCILKNYHGTTKHTITLNVVSEKFSKIKHSFALRNIPGKIKLPSLKKLIQNQGLNQFTKPSFFAEILDDFGKKRKIKAETLPGSNKLTKNISLSFSPNLKPGEKVKYAWGWSCPKSFFPTKQKDYNELGFVAYHPLKKLTFELAFERGFPLTGKPWIEIVDQNGNVLERNLFSICKNEPCYTVFSNNFDPVHQNSTYKGRWKPKKKKK